MLFIIVLKIACQVELKTDPFSEICTPSIVVVYVYRVKLTQVPPPPAQQSEQIANDTVKHKGTAENTRPLKCNKRNNL